MLLRKGEDHRLRPKKLAQRDPEPVADPAQGINRRRIGFLKHGAECGIGDAGFLRQPVDRPTPFLAQRIDAPDHFPIFHSNHLHFFIVTVITINR